jgi:SAM-dependent methyltransferase
MLDPATQVQAVLDRFTTGRMRRLEVLEAGCGSLSNIRLGPNVHVVGLDRSAEALAQNMFIHERIQADLEICDLGDSRYDLIVCWDVLEHLADPVNVLRKFLRAVVPGGLVLLAFPNVLALKSLVAKYTPLSFHLLVHRLIYGRRAGVAPGYEVCPTHLRYSIAPRSIVRLAGRHGFDLELFSLYESGMQRRFRAKLALVGSLWRAVRFLTRALSAGLIDAEATECVLILRRLETSTLSPIGAAGLGSRAANPERQAAVRFTIGESA